MVLEIGLREYLGGATEVWNPSVLERQLRWRHLVRIGRTSSINMAAAEGYQPPPPRPKVGLAVFVTSNKHPNCVLLGVRRGSHGAQKISLPGGHVEFGESWEECCHREVLEETGLKLKDIRFGTVVNAVWTEGVEKHHYIDIVMTGEVDATFKEEPENPEPDKCEGWEWHHWGGFPAADALFTPLRIILETGYSPFTSHFSSS